MAGIRSKGGQTIAYTREQSVTLISRFAAIAVANLVTHKILMGDFPSAATISVRNFPARHLSAVIGYDWEFRRFVVYVKTLMHEITLPPDVVHAHPKEDSSGQQMLAAQRQPRPVEKNWLTGRYYSA